MLMLIISLYIGKNNCFQKWAICNSSLCDAFINLFFKCPIVPRLWGTMGQWPGYIGTIWQILQHDHYNVNIILADGLIVTSPLEINQKIEYRRKLR